MAFWVKDSPRVSGFGGSFPGRGKSGLSLRGMLGKQGQRNEPGAPGLKAVLLSNSEAPMHPAAT